MSNIFRKFAIFISNITGKPAVFLAALFLIFIWAGTGPLFGFSDTWQLVINTTTTIITFLMVFLIQNTQNRDSKAIQLKLDELIKNQKGARNTMINIEELPDEEIEKLHAEAQKLHNKYAKAMEDRQKRYK
jgi:low affinity Fe/Cu permease